MDILESKLLAPHMGKLLHRQRLARKFANLEGKRLILVTAGAGYGKTTMVAQALRPSSNPDPDKAMVWYRLDRFDRDITTFARYLVRGLDKIYPGIEAAFFEDGVGPGGTGGGQDWFITLLKVLESRTRKALFIVLDDYHLLSPPEKNDPAGFSNIHSCIQFFLERLPDHVRLVLISRTDPPLKLSSLRVRQQVLEIHEPDLVFCPDETAALFSLLHHRVPEKKTLSALYRQTCGWAAGLVLFGAAFEKQPGGLPFAGTMNAQMSQYHMFDFLEENLYATQPPDMQQFMAGAALMDPMQTTVCDRILGCSDSQARFKRMMAAHLMVFPMGEDETLFHYHHLFRDFLLKKLHQTLPESQIRQLHLDIAKLLEARENHMALVHYIEARAYDEVVRFMTAYELEFLVQGKIRFVRTCLEKIPRQVIAENPRLLFMEAKQYSYFGQPDKSIACLTSACRILRRSCSDAYVSKCLVDLGAQYYYTGHIPEAQRLMVQVLEEGQTDSVTYILAVTYLTFFCTVLGDLDQARMYERQTRAVAGTFPEFEQTAALASMDITKAYILYIQADFEKAMELNLTLIDRCRASGLGAFLPLAYYHASATDCLLGKYETGLSYAREGIRAAGVIHLRDSQNGWLYIARSENHLGLGQLDDAQAHAQTAFKIFRQPGNRWGMANALDLMARISLAADDIAKARSRVTRALEIIKGYGLDMSEAIIMVSHARVLMAGNAFEHACAVLSRARRHLKPIPWHLCSAWLLDARCCHALGREEAAWSCFQKGLAIARKKQFDRLVRADAGDLVQGMAQKRSGSIFSSYLGTLSAGHVQVRALQGLDVRVLGRFRVSVKGRPIEHSQWPGAKSRTLFQYLALHHFRGFIPKDVLVEMLWPDQDPEKTGKRFNTAMSRLRKLLEPDLPPRSPSSYILRKNDHYSLCFGPEGGLDLAQFQDLAKKALGMEKTDPRAALALGRKAERLYTGPLLEDSPYQDWCIRMQDDTKDLYCRLCRMLTLLCRDVKDPDPGVLYAQNCLQADPFDEFMHQQLICFFLESGKYGLAAKAAMTCREKMTQIDCPLSPKTMDLLKKIPVQPYPAK